MPSVAYDISPEAESLEIQKRFDKLIATVRPLLKDDDEAKIGQAFEIAFDAHRDMRRKSGEPYIYHPLEVAQICAEELGLGTTSIVCALLHDVVEDTDIPLSEIDKKFGHKVAQIIDGLTKISGIFEKGNSAQAENFKKLLLTLSEDVRVIFIKLADRLHNMRTLGSMSRDKQLKIASETTYIYAPLAHRLGLHAFKTELEDLYLKYAEPKEYREIADALNARRDERQQIIDDFILPLRKSLIDNAITFEIYGRPKSIYSIWKKMKNQGKKIEDIFDLFAIRIIYEANPKDEKRLCWHIYSIVTDHYTADVSRLRDWITAPRSNGYESLHATVVAMNRKVEVQIRSRRMHEVAEKGYAAHFKYKGNDMNVGPGIDDWLNQVREFMSMADESAIEFLNDFRSSLFQEEVTVFTPKGDLKVLPSGATALDFAYAVHSELGSRCFSTKINGRIVELSYVLKNGDQVEILTNKKQTPKEDWLRFVKTSKAKANIKDALREINKIHITAGREIVIKKLKLMGVELTFDVTNQLRAFFNARDPSDLFYRFGMGYLAPDEVKRWKAEREATLRRQEKKDHPTAEDGKGFVKELKRLHGDRPDSDMLLIGEDMDKIDYTLAPCCNPIPGDEVFGFVTINEGIRIHKTTCPNARELLSMHGHRAIKARWTSQALSFLAGVRIRGEDRVGIVSDVSEVISKQHRVNMRSITVDTREGGVFEGKIKLFVQDTSHLRDLMTKLKKIRGVAEVTRFEYAE